MPVVRLTPVGCIDATYSPGGVRPTGMGRLSNLVPAPDSPNEWVPRPGAVEYGASTTEFVVAQLIVGTILYGMRRSTTFSGKDAPFAFNLVTGAYISLTGVLSSNLPSNATTTGTWVPPHMEVIGIYVVVTHTGFSGAGANFFGAINTVTKVWTAQNTSTNALPSVPVWVMQYQQRAYFFCNPNAAQPATLATDVLNPLSRGTAVAGFILTYGDNVPLLCGGTYSFAQVSAGGLITAAYIFKQDATQIWQITGDFAAGAPGAVGQIALQALNISTGTFAPNTVVQSPQGLAFMAPDGLRIIDPTSQVADPIGFAGAGVALPFINAVIPSRMAAACNATTIRVTVENAISSNQEDWCYDLVRRSWYGPHTYPISLLSYYPTGATFVVSPTPAITGKQLLASAISPVAGSVYTENGGAEYTCAYGSVLYPERDGVVQLTSFKSILYLGYGGGTTTFSISLLDKEGGVIVFTQLQYIRAPVVWGGFTWGSGQSLGSSVRLSGVDVPWPNSVAFDRMSVLVTVTAAPGVRLGSYLTLVDELGYTVDKAN